MTQTALNTNAQQRGEDVEYLCFAEESMWGQLILGFCKSSIKWKISKIVTARIKQGLGGKMGNKGAVIIRFNLDDTSICVTNAHLESGQKQIADRVTQFKQIVSDSLVGKRNQKYDYQSHTVKLFFGDLNFRIDLDYEVAKVASVNFKDDDLMILQAADQLNKVRKLDPELKDIWEGVLNFRPTYKYDKNCDRYDSSKKQRVPAWCDRILWFKNDKHIEQVTYERKENQFSDHRPVISFMNIMTYDHDNKLMRELKEQLIKQK